MQSPCRRRGLLVALIAAGLVLVAGCGSSAVSKQDFIARADAICQNTIREVRDVAPSSTGAGISLPALARYLGAVTPIVGAEVRQLRALPRPAADRPLLNRYLAAVQLASVHYRALAAAARAGDRTAIEAATAELAASPSAALATRYGLTICAGPTGTAPSS